MSSAVFWVERASKNSKIKLQPEYECATCLDVCRQHYIRFLFSFYANTHTHKINLSVDVPIVFPIIHNDGEFSIERKTRNTK